MTFDFYVLVLNEKFIFYDSSFGEVAIVKLPVEPLPYMPFYHELFQEDQELTRSYETIIRDTLGLSERRINNIIKKKFMIIIPDDARFVERRMISEFFMHMGARVVYCQSQCMLGAGKYGRYVYVSQTKRVLYLAYIESDQQCAFRAIDIAKIDQLNIVDEVRRLHQDCVDISLPIIVSWLDPPSVQISIGEQLTLANLHVYLSRCTFKNDYKGRRS